MIEAGCEHNPTQWNEGTDLGFAADVANDVYVAMVRSALFHQPAPVAANASAEQWATDLPDGSVSFDAYAGWSRDQLKNRCLELVGRIEQLEEAANASAEISKFANDLAAKQEPIGVQISAEDLEGAYIRDEPSANASAELQNYLGEMLRALGMSDAAQPKSPHEVFQSAIAEMKRQLANASAEARPDDLRAQGWSVAVHNDYRLDGEAHTFWLLTKNGRAVKGEGHTDADALNQIRKELYDDCCGAVPPCVGCAPTHPHASDCAQCHSQPADRLFLDETSNFHICGDCWTKNRDAEMRAHASDCDKQGER
jgi:hypothetical protein